MSIVPSMACIAISRLGRNRRPMPSDLKSLDRRIKHLKEMEDAYRTLAIALIAVPAVLAVVCVIAAVVLWLAT